MDEDSCGDSDTTDPDQELTEFGTGLQVTSIVRSAGGQLRWRRRPGPDGGGWPRRPPPGLPAAAATASSDAVVFAMARHRVTDGTAGPGCWEWPVPSTVSAALLLGAGPDRPGPLPAVMAALGSQLRVLHGIGAEGASTRLPEWLRRLRRWLATGTGPRAAPRWHGELRGVLGDARLTRLAEWADMVAATPSTAWVHGFCTLGSVVLGVDPARGAAVVLSGPDATVGPAEIDLGCVLGELAELRESAARRGGPRPVLDELRDRFTAGYGDGWDTVLAGRIGALRIASHAHDFAAFVGWNDELGHYARHLTRLVDTGAAEVVARSSIGSIGCW